MIMGSQLLMRPRLFLMKICSSIDEAIVNETLTTNKDTPTHNEALVVDKDMPIIDEVRGANAKGTGTMDVMGTGSMMQSTFV
ncbi:hypothetical protein GOP47_0029022 [Adiantum capillus-veneris]|nr:hypothetical protein GOP47_0029022 [Adiantum capillus-veneris]